MPTKNDALAQLKAAQDRKNELAQQNEQLTAKVTDRKYEAKPVRKYAMESTNREALIPADRIHVAYLGVEPARCVVVEDSVLGPGAVTLEIYRYDGLGRRVLSWSPTARASTPDGTSASADGWPT